ncbi:MAG TPA: 3-deoxy-manno-octulosonate cytidylyltransferase [Planctomycetota bacterium]|nr:3-deoxy-manno-octulosonate cytidylyltransferase [Planctomycetota bacterium]
MKAAAILPARLSSTRLPRKMLLAETGRPLIEHSARNALSSGLFERVVVATDSTEIADVLGSVGIEAVLTRDDHASGTDRVREAVDALGFGDFDVVVNVQGDEPELSREDLARLVHAFEDVRVEVATLCAPLGKSSELGSPQVVKVVRDRAGDALYFSRAAIPCAVHARAGNAAIAGAPRRHVGVYAFRPPALARFCELPIGVLESVESLEQLRWLEAGYKLRVLDAAEAPLGIDTRSEYDAFVARVKSRGGD